MVVEKKGFFEVDSHGELNWNDGEKLIFKHVTGMCLLEGEEEPRPLMQTILGMFICERIRCQSENTNSQLSDETIEKGDADEPVTVVRDWDLACTSLACWVFFLLIVLLCL